MPSLLLRHTKRFNEAIADLFKLNHDESALMLIYAFIDRMAWLSVEDDSNGNDFKDWVSQFLLPQDKFLCNADDLWAARCGLLHTGAVEARDTKKGRARKIHYCGGGVAVNPESVPEDEVFVDVGMLHCNLIEAVSDFQSYLEKDSGKLSTANAKLKSIITKVGVA